MAAVCLFAVMPQAQAAQAAVKPMVPNDTFYGWEWGMEMIGAPQAWALAEAAPTSTREVVVAVVDGGVDFTHPDLKGALWTDPDEKPNKQDDDADGYVDDLHGWNFVTNASDTRPMGGSVVARGAWEHGTMTSSLIAGRGNDNIGMAGMAWKAKIMPLVILGADGSGGTERLAKAIRYAIYHHADIINLSLEGEEEDQDVSQAITEATARGILVVIAAGNGPMGKGVDLDKYPLFPSCQKGAAGQGVLVVSAVDDFGERNPSSNYGNCVNIAAPGTEILAGRPIYDPLGQPKDVSGYGMWNGTSLAAPFVSGAAALLKALNPDWTGEQLADRILDTVQPFSDAKAAAGLGRGVLDAAEALKPPTNAAKYGPLMVSAANPGNSPMIWVTDLKGEPIYSFMAGNEGDHRGLRAVFVLWDEDRRPEVLIVPQGDVTGAWRVYRLDGVLLAAGQVSQGPQDTVKGGFLLASQDLKASGRQTVLLTEAAGQRAWRLEPDKGLGKAFYATLDEKAYGSMAVGMQHPAQTIVLLVRSMPNSSLKVMRDWGLGEEASVTTTRPENLFITEGRTESGRELIRLIQSGKPTYLLERGGALDVSSQAVNDPVWRQAPLGLDVPGKKGRKSYDFWPR